MTTPHSARPASLRPLPAPEGLRTLQEFINTRDQEAGTDELDSPVALAVWLSRHGLLPEGTPVDKGCWKNALAVRSGLHRLIWTNVRGVEVSVELKEEIVQGLNRSITDRRLRLQFDDDGSARLGAAEDGWPAAATRLLVSVVEAMSDGSWNRLKTCASCQMVFFDSSRNRAGIWCNVRRCGNRWNKKRFRRNHPSSYSSPLEGRDGRRWPLPGTRKA